MTNTHHSVDQKIRIGDIVVGETISQIGIVVKDLQRAMETYWRTLRIGPWKVYTFTPPALREPMIRGKPVEYSMRLALTQMGAVQLELIEPLEGPSIYKEHLTAKGEGLHHIQSRPENVDEVLVAFQEIGIDVLMSGKMGNGAFYYMDTESLLGLIFEVVKRGGTGVPPEATYPPQQSSKQS